MDIMQISLELCWRCEIKLPKSARQRVNPCLCKDCKYVRKAGESLSKGITFKELNSKPLPPPTAEELIEIKEAWKAQNLKVDEMDMVIR
tara:strand:- start:373 stop:639 length:267 start_codon:yes stop_codon:yes gene_type:complete